MRQSKSVLQVVGEMVSMAVIGYIASPAVLSLEEMASGCRPEGQDAEPTPRRLESVSA